MAKAPNTSQSKGRWLMLDPTSQSTDEIVRHIQTLDGVDIRRTSQKIYIRFPEQHTRQRNTSNFSKWVLNIRRLSQTGNNSIGDVRQYCAIMLKRGR